ncbi:MAG: Ldh family oxidoreductase [Sphaerochaetaceae bacterium]
MYTVAFTTLKSFMHDILKKLGMEESNIETIVDIYIEATKRGVGHHDIHNFLSRVDVLRTKKVTINPEFSLLASYGCMESWDGDNGLGELVNTFLMQRAVKLAQDFGIGFATVRNSNHYLASAPYTMQAARQGYIGMIIAKGLPSMGVPGVKGNVIGQSPIGFAFPTKYEWPVMLDICLAYASTEQLFQRAREKQPVPEWWGVGPDGQPTTNAEELLQGTKYPIGEHKGFGLALLCELLTGVFSQGLILDEQETADIAWKSTSHTAIAIKADALMAMEDYTTRSSTLIDRIDARAPGIHIPGQQSYRKKVAYERSSSFDVSDDLFEKLNQCAKALNVKALLVSQK